MKKLYLFLAFILPLQIVNAQNVIPNPGFENWNVNPNYDDPANWGTINGLTWFLGVRTVTKATGSNANSGTAAIKLESKAVIGQGTAPGIAATGTINTSGYIDGGVAFNKRPVSMSGWYKYAPSGTDTASVEATLSKWNSGNQTREEVGRAVFTQHSNVGSYTQFTVNFAYSSADLPDTLIIILLTSSQGNSSPVGSVLFIDDLSFDLCSNFSASASSTNATCTAADGSATIATTNGVMPFTYSWSNSATSATVNVAVGSYTVTVTDWNGCSVTTSATVGSNLTTLTASAASTQSDCTNNNGSAYVNSVSNGTPPYNYLWSENSINDSVINLGPGVYTVTITDANGCSGTVSTSVTTPNGPAGSVAVAAAGCHGDSTGSVNLTVNGGTSPITFLWNTGAFSQNLSNVPAGNYSVIITDANNCSFMVSATVTEPNPLGITSTVTNASSSTSSDGSVVLSVSGGTAPYQTTWNTGNGSNLSAGIYCFTVTDANACTVSDCDTVGAPSSVSLLSNMNIRLFPNPANNHIVIENNSDITTLTISVYGVDGKLLLQRQVNGKREVADVSILPTGLYTYRLEETVSGLFVAGKLVIHR